MLAGTVYNALIDTLSANPKLKGYVKYFYKGLRTNIEPKSMPCIVLEPTQNNESEKDMNQYKDIYFNVDIISFTYSVSKPDKAIVGDDNYKGILDIENDIRACLQSSYNLGGKVIDTRLDPTVFDYSDYPVRGMLIPVRVLYRQKDNV